MSYVQGFVTPVKAEKKDAYLEVARAAGALFREFGALRIVECWEDDVADGQTTDFRTAVKAEAGEKIVFSWIVWPDKEVCAAAARRMMEDERMRWEDMPFDGKRMIYGGFAPIFDDGEG